MGRIIFSKNHLLIMVKLNLTVAIVLLMLIEGLSIYLNMTYHPTSQPWLTIGIVVVFAIIGGIYTWSLKKTK